MTKDKKIEIFRVIQSCLKDICAKDAAKDTIDMLGKIWDLYLLSSEDPRYRDAYGDAVQHLRNNFDWDDEYTFLTRFGLQNADDSVFVKFLNAVVSPDARGSKDEIERYVETINPVLNDCQMAYVKTGENNEWPIYKIRKGADVDDTPIDITKNRIPFFVDQIPSSFPAFHLVSNTWDDYNRKTTFRIRCKMDSNKNWVEIGVVKIMHATEIKTIDVMEREFTELSSGFCSLGQSESYYARIKDLFPNTYKSILFALRDAAYFSTIADRYQHTITFQKSLLRTNEALKTFRRAYAIMEGLDLKESYNFTLNAKIRYFENVVHAHFDFGDLNDENNLDRVKALIGENGAGKSSLLYSLAEALHDEDDSKFLNNKRPYFSKVIAISYSIFDDLYDLTKKSSYNFVYYGLRDKDNELLSEDDKKMRLELSLSEITYKERTSDYYMTLTEVVDKSLLKAVFLKNNKIDPQEMLKLMKNMSSGQAMITSIITELYAHIRENSLILFDEPEVHLHANAITRLVNIIFDVCNEFKSACIVATHSPIILQELLARNVIVVERDKDSNEIYVRAMNTETLGENLTKITEDVFGRSDINKHYGFVIDRLVREGKRESDIEKILKSDGLPMSLNLYLYIRRQLELSRQ